MINNIKNQALAIFTKHLLNMAVSALAVCTLAGCGADEGDDLDAFMRDAPKSMSAHVEPLPQVTPYAPIVYNGDGTLTDPFKGKKAKNGNSQLQPNLNRPKQILEGYPLESLHYVGMMSKQNAKYGLVKTPDNSIQQAKVGDYIGQNYGLITAISDDEIKLKEIIQDELSGDWVERSSSLSMQVEGTK